MMCNFIWEMTQPSILIRPYSSFDRMSRLVPTCGEDYRDSCGVWAAVIDVSLLTLKITLILRLDMLITNGGTFRDPISALVRGSVDQTC
jgi:hypothetical protein